MSKARTSICADCGTSFSYEIVRGSHGRTYCPACRDARVLENKRIYKVRHREKVTAANRAYASARYKNDPEHAERCRERIRYLTETNPEYLSEVRRRSYAKHAAKRRADAALRREVLRMPIYERDGGRCHICKKKVSLADFHIDHLIPISKGGDSRPENLATAHRDCNLTRAAGRLPAQLLLIGGRNG